MRPAARRRPCAIHGALYGPIGPHHVEALRDRVVATLRRGSALHRIVWLLANSCTRTDGALHAQPIPLRCLAIPGCEQRRRPSMGGWAGLARRAVRLIATLSPAP